MKNNVLQLSHTLKTFIETSCTNNADCFFRKWFVREICQTVYFGLCESSLHLQRKEAQIKYCLWEINLAFYMKIFKQIVKFTLKNSNLKCWLCFRLFFQPTKKSLRLSCRISGNQSKRSCFLFTKKMGRKNKTQKQ